MKIPETGNVGAYYGNEENGQWQPNGVIIDNGVGGGVVGSGDAGVLRPAGPVYPVHMPRGGPMSGYMMSSGYYGAAGAGFPVNDFADYMWMENEEEFDKQVMQQLEEEALMEQCIEAMLEDEQRERSRAARDNGHAPTTSNSSTPTSLQEAVSKSTLNPLAAEFVPGRARPPPKERSVTKERTPEDVESPESETKESQIADEKESRPQVEPPEVSAADVQPIEGDKRQNETLKSKTDKRKAKVECKAKNDAKVKSVQSEVNAAPSENIKDEVKSVNVEAKSEVKSDDDKAESIEVIKQSSPSPPLEEVGGVKPINYAAAAKANKPKKASAPSATSSPPKPTDKVKDKNPPKGAAPKAKADRPAAVHRKNSAK